MQQITYQYFNIHNMEKPYKIFISIILILLLLVDILNAERILVIHPVYVGSHIFVLRNIWEKLLEKGHKITVIRFKESSNIKFMQHKNIEEIILAINNSEGNIPFLTKENEAKFVFPDSLMWERGLYATAVFDGGMKTAGAACDALLGNKTFIEHLEKLKFKMAVVDLVYNECGLALAHHLELPVVSYWGVSFVSGEAQYMTPFNSPAYLSHLYLHVKNDLSFWFRCRNFLYGIGSHIVMQIHFYNLNYFISKHLPDVPHPSTLLSNISGVLINSHWVFDYPQQLPPFFFQVGGLQIKKPKPLPKELEEIFRESKFGVVLFSLGSNFDSKSLPKDVFQSYFNAFSKLKQNVIVKCRSRPEEIPPNVKIFSFLPQNDVLASNKTVAFVTHGGLHSVMEAIHYGVKMVTIPIFFDQGYVAIRLSELGVSIELNKDSGETEIYEAINRVIEDKRYEKNMNNLHELYHSSFENGLDRSVWLIEHVLKFGGDDRFKLASKDLNFFQYFCIDVVLFFIFIILIGLFIVKFAFNFIIKKEKVFTKEHED